MYRVEDWNNKERIIKRLSKYEKRILYYLLDGKIFNIKIMRETIGMPHRSSMSRVIKTLEGKGLIITRPLETGGKYKKRISLTPAGKQIGDWIYIEIPIGELVPRTSA